MSWWMMMMWVGCKKKESPPVPVREPVVAAAPVAADGLGEVVRALSVRDGEPDCAQVEALTPSPVSTLLRVVDQVTMPPYVPMRAATCLIAGHGAEVEEALTSWVREERYAGLGQLVLLSFEALPEEVALRVGPVALEGPGAEKAREVMEGSPREAVRALVE